MRILEVNDQAIRRINMEPLERLFTDNFHRLVKTVEGYGFKIRVVGGSVRDMLIGRTPRDIDLNTDALPDEIMYVLEKHDYKYVTKGIPHGTVKVVFSPTEEYEITSIAYSIDDECCPEKVVVHSSQSWEGDAKRRDFTVDTLSVDMDGHLYDYVGGMEDLRNQFIRFIGDPEERVKKDPVLILRFFKLLALFKDPKFDKSVLPVLKNNMKRLKRLKPHRIALELSNIARSDHAEQILRLMSNLGADEYTAPPPPEEDIHEGVRGIVKALYEINAMSVVPAIKLGFDTGRAKVFYGHNGEMHADIFETINPAIHHRAKNTDLGFVDTQTGHYMTRMQALQMVTR
jgi:tRNA nucleotidyltransferase/poly(A) polymerase